MRRPAGLGARCFRPCLYSAPARAASALNAGELRGWNVRGPTARRGLAKLLPLSLLSTGGFRFARLGSREINGPRPEADGSLRGSEAKAAAQADRSLRGKENGRRGRLTKPPPCGGYGLAPMRLRGWWFRRAARRNQRLHASRDRYRRPAGASVPTASRPGTRAASATREPDREPGSPRRDGNRIGEPKRLRPGRRSGRDRCGTSSEFPPLDPELGRSARSFLPCSKPPDRSPAPRGSADPIRRSEGWRKRQPSSRIGGRRRATPSGGPTCERKDFVATLSSGRESPTIGEGEQCE